MSQIMPDFVYTRPADWRHVPHQPVTTTSAQSSDERTSSSTLGLSASKLDAQFFSAPGDGIGRRSRRAARRGRRPTAGPARSRTGSGL